MGATHHRGRAGGRLPGRAAAARPTAVVLAAGFVVVAFLLAGCFSLDTDIGLNFQVSVEAEEEALDATATAGGGTATVGITARIVGSLPCDILRGDVDRRGSALEVVVLLRADVNSCPGTPPTTFRYVLSLFNVPAGEWDLTLEHRFQGVDQEDEVVLTQAVTVR